MNTFQGSRCVFCERLVLGSSDAPWDTPVAETDEYLIVPTKGSLVPGWLLVVSKQHALCSGELHLHEFGGLEEAINVAKEMVERHFSAATVFEHGPASAGTALGCGIDHLHLHVTPLNFSLIEAVNVIIPNVLWQKLEGFSQLPTLHAKGIGYAMVDEPHRGMKWFQPPPGIRQPLRRAIATQLGSPELFDYATHPHTENVLHTLEQFAVGV